MQQKNELMVKFGRRLMWARKKMGLSQGEFGKKIGVSHTQVSRIEKGEQQPSGGLRKSIEAVAGISLQWLDTGEGDWQVGGRVAEGSPPWGGRVAAAPGEAAELLAAWETMSPEGRRQALEFVRFLLEKEKIGDGAKK